MSAAGRVAIGICTAHRPEMLKCCLAALEARVAALADSGVAP